MTVVGTGPLTTASGALATDGQDSGQAGAGGPVLVEEQVLLEQVAPVERERALRVRDGRHHGGCLSCGVVVVDVPYAVGVAWWPTWPTATASRSLRLGSSAGAHRPRLFSRPQFLSTVICPVRKDSHV